ncbi:DNA replication and repair protein RecF [Methylocella silvestris BL2]|uniref:DNA replication and repair protein RecF n=1 Tax=Methylocella silvestris (strain DSM 15510 / CIP 108128 / LMG 27833 / NCIMB 13906 / BL2) TaxID=395965 RepID=B8EQB6_METSB|nr:DNA replication/repair protein RecF [Methylocella silvestris]ACK52129.1 DNA replication and repair protein RecF [Methylocella silvestris BL2]
MQTEALATESSPAPPAKQARRGVRRLTLADFRSYASLDMEILAQTVVLTGDNGAGKTNVLEALSLLTPGRGLRRAELSDCARNFGGGGFAVSIEIDAEGGRLQLGTGVEPNGGAALARKFRIDREPAPSIRAFCDHIRVVWLTPAMDGLFVGSPGDRRRFLDRLVLSLDADHGARVNALERALRSRNRLLEERGAGNERLWLDAVEREVAELAIAVAAARFETVSKLAALIAQAGPETEGGFPLAELSLDGDIDRLIETRPALEAEDEYRKILRDNRGRDAAAGRTLIGPQSSDLAVRHARKQAAASHSSTGEQKALLVGLILAQARLIKAMSGLAPLVLLDEIAAHFDPKRRAALYELLGALGAQVWLTGADPSAFAELEGKAQMLQVTPGAIRELH